MNLLAALRDRLRGTPCRAIGSELRVVGENRSRYPDACVICTGRNLQDQEARDPVVIFEILSPGTAATDRIRKPREYFAIPSAQR